MSVVDRKASITARLIAAPLAAALALSAGSALAGGAHPDDPPPASIESLKGVRPGSELITDDIPAVRRDVLREAAHSLGVRGGFARRSWEINNSLSNRKSHLDTIYNFTNLLVSVGDVQRAWVMPPIVEYGEDAVASESDLKVRISDQVLRVIQGPRLLTSMPTWQQYLVLPAATPELPPDALRPKTPAEEAAWQRWVDEGWRAGMEQANETFKISLNRLERDLTGMMRFRELAAKGMASMPYVAKTENGVTGDKMEMRVGDRLLTITEDGGLVADAKRWNPVMPR